METEQTKLHNEDALKTASNDVFIDKLNYSSIINSNNVSKDYLFKNYYSDHVVELSSDDSEINHHSKLMEHSNHSSLDHSSNHTVDDNFIADNNEKNNENKSLIKDETIIKIDNFNEQDNLLNEFNDSKKEDNVKQTELKDKKKCNENDNQEQTNHSSATKFNHHHHHHHLNNRTMDLVFRNICVSIPASKQQEKDSINNQNWFKQIFYNYLSKNNLIKFNSAKLIKPKKEQRPILDNQRDILSNVSGYSRPGQLLAVMGPSGSGKTTLLNALSGRLKIRKGSITVNGEELNKKMKHKMGYVMQNDIFLTGLTLKQTLMYTALLRMPDSISKAKKKKHVQRVIELLDLTSCQDTVIGDFMLRGLSGGEKKRASIACELLTNPAIMLLDEPTSNLDSCTAFNLMQKIKEYAIKEGKTVICTIHQPSSSLFYMFDKLLLLANGQLAYFGKSTHVVPFFFEALGYTISPHYNPADLMMEKIKQKDELPKIVSHAKNLIKNYPILNHSHRRGSNASNCKHYLKINKMESQTEWSLIGIEDDLEFNNHNHSNNLSNHIHSTNNSQSDNNPHHFCAHHHSHFQKHHLSTLKESIECINYNKQTEHACNCKQLLTATRSIHDDDSGRSSWTDRSSTTTFSSNNSCSSSTEDVYSEVNFSSSSGGHDFEIEPNNNNLNDHHQHNLNDDQNKWATSFLTQVNVLTRRNFYETRHRMLSKLNWIQTIGLGLLSGLMWFQMNRSESTLNDLRGFLFFSTSYWMLFAWFGCLITIETEREIMVKERSAGAYRLSAFYIAKMLGELPLVITLPSLYFFICYPMFQLNLNLYNFLFQWLFMILCALAAQSIGLFIGLTTMSLEVSVTVSAIYSTAINLFGGYYSATLPYWLSWVPYISVLNYAFQNMQLIEFYFSGPIRCASINSKYDYCLREISNLKEKINNTNSIQLNKLLVNKSIENSISDKQIDKLFIPIDDLISTELNSSSFWLNIGILICFIFVFRLMGYLVLRFRMPK